MMLHFPRSGYVVVVAVALLSSPAEAFGQRQAGRGLGVPLQVQPSPSQAATGSKVMGSARFLRENRSRRDFVGNSRGELTGFVGNRQALGVGKVPPAIGALTQSAQTAGNRNTTVPPLPKKAMYYSRLVLDEVPLTPYGEERAAAAFDRLRERIGDLSQGAVTLTKDGRRAILQGTVPSRADADRLAALATFEPGIDDVDNQLLVAADDLAR